MPKGSSELTNVRREEIFSGCKKLYQTMRFKEITLNDIAGATHFTRTSIYNHDEKRHPERNDKCRTPLRKIIHENAVEPSSL